MSLKSEAKGNLEYCGFPTSLPGQYWHSSMGLNFGDQTGPDAHSHDMTLDIWRGPLSLS